MLARLRPVIVMELAPYVLRERGASIKELLSLLAPVGYRFVDTDTGAAVPFDAAALDKLFPHGGCRNVVALPLQERPGKR